MGEYTDRYLKSDITLLADVFEDFRSLTLRESHLDPANYLTAPSLANDIMYHMTNQVVENITDIDQLLMFEDGKRGGMCSVGFVDTIQLIINIPINMIQLNQINIYFISMPTHCIQQQ